jgi:signal transduction histidine kinase
VRRLRPRGILGQLALLILAAFLAAQAASVWIFAGERGEALRIAQRIETVERAGTVARLLERAEADERALVLEAAGTRLRRFTLAPEPLVGPEAALHPRLRARLLGRLGLDPDRDVRLSEGPAAPRTGPGGRLHGRLAEAGIAPVEMRLSIPLDEGAWLNVTSRVWRPGVQLPPAILGTTLVSLALLMGALWLGLRRITGPLRRLAEAADAVGADAQPVEMPRDGPREVQALAEALARMQRRLAGMMVDRTRMLAALGHDLRSPITALRLRAEMVEDAETRERMTATLDEMQEMVEATLAYARGVSPDQPPEPVELAALLAELAGELSETGPAVTVAPPVPAVLPLRRLAVRRALRNLLENAQRYGGGARVRLEAEAGAVRIVIEDDGPGLPEADLERVFDPFVRLETSRSRETGGTGLGLPIARAILRAHGGDVHLANRAAGGLRATVTLPPAASGPPDGDAPPPTPPTA